MIFPSQLYTLIYRPLLPSVCRGIITGKSPTCFAYKHTRIQGKLMNGEEGADFRVTLGGRIFKKIGFVVSDGEVV